VNFEPGDRVVICAADDFFAYVDGWRGTVTGFNMGNVEVQCARPDGVKTLYVPAAQLALSV
jgi:hypothetical protein